MIQALAKKIVSKVDIEEIVLTKFIQQFRIAYDKERNPNIKARLELKLYFYKQQLKEHKDLLIANNIDDEKSKKLYLIWACATLLCIGLFFFVRWLK